MPENCTANQPLTWNRSSQALKVYEIKGNSVGAGNFDLKNWQNPHAMGGSWQNWFVTNGSFSVTPNAAAISCITTGSKIYERNNIMLYPNPSSQVLNFNAWIDEITITDLIGQAKGHMFSSNNISVDHLTPGVYFIELKHNHYYSKQKFIKE